MYDRCFRSRMTGLCLTLSVLATTVATAQATTPNFQQMSAEERTAYFARIRAASEQDRRRMMDLLRLKQPDSLPPPDAAPNRPAALAQRQGSTKWSDPA